MNKIYIAIIAIISIFTTTICIDTHSIVNGLLGELILEKEGKIIDNEEYMSDNPQTVEFEDYKITLASLIYDSENISGTCRFEVIKNDGNDKVEYKDTTYTHGANWWFGDDNRFSFRFGMGSGGTEYYLDYKREGNKLIVYMDFSVTTDVFYDRLYLMDSHSGQDIEDAVGVFELSDDIKTINFPVTETMNIRLSEPEIIIQSIKEIRETDNKVTIYYKDGKYKEVECSINIYIDGQKKYYTDEIFLEPLHIKDIDYIVYNGQEYHVEKENINVDGLF